MRTKVSYETTRKTEVDKTHFRIVRFVELRIRPRPLDERTPSFAVSRSNLTSRRAEKTSSDSTVRKGGGGAGEGGNTTLEGLRSPVDSSSLERDEEKAREQSVRRPGPVREKERRHSLWQPMSRAVHETEKLRTAEDEVEDLRDEKEEKSFGEVGEDGDAGEGHAREVTERVSWEGSRRIPVRAEHTEKVVSTSGRCRKGERRVEEERSSSPVVIKQASANSDKRKHKVETEEMPPDHLLSAYHSEQAHSSVLPNLAKVRKVDSREGEVEEIVRDDRQGDDEGLGNFNSVDSGQDVDGVGREGGEEGHIDVVEGSCSNVR